MTQPQKDKILIVDDEPFNRELLVRVLRRKYQLLEAESAEEGLSILSKESEDIFFILSDHLMPRMLGSEFLRQAKKTWPQIQSMLLTGYEDDQDVKAVKADGIVLSVLSKPWQRAELEELVDQAYDLTHDD